jgi:hypothetical protein
MKTLSNLFLSLILVLGTSCSDEITTYKFSKQGQTTTQQMPYQAEVKATPVKTCSPPCTGNTSCNAETGKCEATAASKVAPVNNKLKAGHSPNTYHFDYVVLKNGRESLNDY